MVIVRLMGGIGNQLFQYAFGRQVALRKLCKLKIDISWFNENFKKITPRKFELDKFNIPFVCATEKEISKEKGEDRTGLSKSLFYRIQNLKPYYKKNVVIEKSLQYDNKIYNNPRSAYYMGYWQTEKYFYNIKDVLLKEFTLKKNIEGKTCEILKLINQTVSVSLHIRRGDYISNPTFKEVYCEVGMLYFNKAIQHFLKINNKTVFFLFSDDLQWAKENFKGDNYIFIDEEDAAISLYLMSKCKHNITCNSTFSWWGAWLNTNNDKIIITPERWFKKVEMYSKDLIPENWILLKNEY